MSSERAGAAPAGAGSKHLGEENSRRSRWASRIRPAALVLHRWVGLVIAVFLVVAGSTGSLLAFFADLDAALNPELFHVEPPAAGAMVLDPIELRERIQAQIPEHPIAGVILDIYPDKSVNYWIDDRETFVDPYTGKILGTRSFGDISEGKRNLLTFIYRLHYSLSLGDVGTWIFGAIALLWTFDCFVGAYLTFPVGAPRGDRKSRTAWLVRWAPAWLLKTNQLFSAVFTWHRASGLWVWGMLLVFSWSAVALNLGEQVYDPAMNVILGEHHHDELPAIEPPRVTPKLDFSLARERGRTLMLEESKRRGFETIGERWLDYDPEHGAYGYTVESTLDLDQRLPETTVYFDGDDGRQLSFHASTGSNVRNSVDAWLIALHFGAIRELGVAYRAFVCLLGILVTLLSVTGIWIWWRKRRKRRRAPRSPAGVAPKMLVEESV